MTSSFAGSRLGIVWTAVVFLSVHIGFVFVMAVLAHVVVVIVVVNVGGGGG